MKGNVGANVTTGEDLARIVLNSQNYLAGELQDHLPEDDGDREVVETFKEILKVD